MRAKLAMIAALTLSGCAMLPQSSPFLSGQWGGPHISLLLEGGLGTIEYDCASGTIDSPLAAAHDGRFTGVGTHRPGQGGPIRVGQIFTSYRATYSGTVTKDKSKMTLNGQLEDGTILGPFELTLGSPGQLTRCL